MSIITSLQNPKVKYAISLREKRERRKTGLLLVDGYDELMVALASGAQPVELFFCPPMFRNAKQAALLAQLDKAKLFEVDARVFQKISYRDNPDGWLATIPSPEKALTALTLSEIPFIVIAESVEKPGNLGAMLRTADAVGIDALISCDPLTDWGNPNIVRASKGSLFTVQVADSSNQAAIQWLREKQIQIVVATPDAPKSYTEVDLTLPVAIVMGTEHAGLTSTWLQAADSAVSIPMFGKVNSLNVATATALMMYEGLRQRRGL